MTSIRSWQLQTIHSAKSDWKEWNQETSLEAGVYLFKWRCFTHNCSSCIYRTKLHLFLSPTSSCNQRSATCLASSSSSSFRVFSFHNSQSTPAIHCDKRSSLRFHLHFCCKIRVRWSTTTTSMLLIGYVELCISFIIELILFFSFLFEQLALLCNLSPNITVTLFYFNTFWHRWPRDSLCVCISLHDIGPSMLVVVFIQVVK